MAIEAITGMGYHLIFLLVGLLLIYVIASGYGTELVGKSRAAISGLSPCEDLGQQDFDYFLNAMNETYNDCKDRDMCDMQGCRKMTLNEGNPGDYYQVSYDELKDKGLNDFITNDFLEYVSIFCKTDDANACGNEIDAYYEPERNFKIENILVPLPPSNYVTIKEKTSDNIVCSYWISVTSDGGFSVANGAKITIKAKKTPGGICLVGGDDTDIKLTIDGGIYTTSD